LPKATWLGKQGQVAQESIPTTIFPLPGQSLIWAEAIWAKKNLNPHSWTQKIDS